MRIMFGTAAAAAAGLAAVLALAAASPGRAAAADQTPATPPDLKAEINALIHRLEGAGHGIIKWDGAERFDVRQDGAATVADIDNARILVERPQQQQPQAEKEAHITLDHIQVRRTPGPGGSFDLSVSLPKAAALRGPDDSKVDLALDGATVHAILDGKSERAREISLGFNGARLDDKKSGDWIKVGPLSGSYKLVPAADGSWTAPSGYELKGVEFFIAQGGPVGGTLDRIAASGNAAGPDLAAATRLRDQFSAMQQQDLSPNARGGAFIRLLPDMLSQYSLSQAKFTASGLTVRKPDSGAPLFSLANASIGFSLSGLSGKEAALRITLKHDGLSLGPGVRNANRIPRHGALDLGLEDVSTAALRTIIEAADKARESTDPAQQQQARQQMMGAAAMLDPVFRVYGFVFDTPDVGIEAAAQAKGSPISPKGYTAAGDVSVRGFDALRELLVGIPLSSYLPLLRELGTAATAPDGTPRVNFHVTSAPPKFLTINGNDVDAWLGVGGPGGAGPGALRPSRPAMSGADVRAVQQALTAADIPAPQNGIYDGPTAAAVARFQKKNGLNVNGVVDAATRRKLGVPAPPPPPPPPAPGER